MARETRSICSAGGCGIRAAIALGSVPLCLRHAREIEWRLGLLGVGPDEYQGNLLDLLEAQHESHVGRALSREARLVREKLRRGREALDAGQLSLLKMELRFALAQFDAITSTAPEHKTARLADRLWQLQHRIDDLRASILKLRPESRNGSMD